MRSAVDRPTDRVAPADLLSIRRETEALCSSLAPDDFGLQSMPDASPARWHLAHTTWFFETFVLAPIGVPPHDARWAALFNSYYEGAGARFSRPERSLLSRPTTGEVMAWRRLVDDRLTEAIDAVDPFALTVGLQHEQQHQELLIMDLVHAFWRNPLRPVLYARTQLSETALPLRFQSVRGGVAAIGAVGPGFAFDNELPRHQVMLAPYRLASRPVTAGEYLAFIDDGGYARPTLWLSEGWATVQREGWRAPLYWERDDLDGDGAWRVFGPHGTGALDPDALVLHVSYYEADAYARWAGARLPTEAEWEHARPPGAGACWEWTASAYLPYPGFRPWPGVLGEYNGKFMCGQMVLRGGAAITPHGHARPTYRNYYPPAARWMWSGIRLARDGGDA